ncbi:hypothetical protein D3OALGB2SA_4085 [Olavius algarvensis associated proteobacterium Delta 3]|nr:hypothetical protein D3OALGB2SA_4085 [Olavius algarvensis associated proteobacterium Delta 3]
MLTRKPTPRAARPGIPLTPVAADRYDFAVFRADSPMHYSPIGPV